MVYWLFITMKNKIYYHPNYFCGCNIVLMPHDKYAHENLKQFNEWPSGVYFLSKLSTFFQYLLMAQNESTKVKIKMNIFFIDWELKFYEGDMHKILCLGENKAGAIIKESAFEVE